MVAQGLGQLLEAPQLEMEVQQRSDVQGVLVEVLRQGTCRRLQGLHERIRHSGKHLVGCGRVGDQFLRRLHQRIEGALHGAGRGLRRGADLADAQFGAVHAPRTLDQVVRLVDQHGQLPVQGLRQAPEQAVAVEQVVHIAHHHIGPAHQLLAQVVGADVVAQRDLTLGRAIQPAQGDRLLAGGGQAVVEPAGQRTGVAVAGLVGVLATLVLGHQRQHPQRPARNPRAQLAERLQGRDAPRALAGQVGQLVDALHWHGPKHREQCAHRLADPGWRLGQQAAPVGGCAVDRFGQFALSGAERVFRKRQACQRRVASGTVRCLLLRPGEEGRAALRQDLVQLVGAEDLPQFNFGLARDIEVDERQGDFGQATAAAEERAVGLQLRPMQLPPVFRDVVRVSADGLDLLQAAAPRVIAVGAAANAQSAHGGLQRDLGLVVLPTALRDRALTRQSLECCRGGREAPVQVAALRRELAEFADGDGVGPAWRNWGRDRGRERCLGGHRIREHERHCRDWLADGPRLGAAG